MKYQIRISEILSITRKNVRVIKMGKQWCVSKIVSPGCSKHSVPQSYRSAIQQCAIWRTEYMADLIGLDTQTKLCAMYAVENGDDWHNVIKYYFDKYQ